MSKWTDERVNLLKQLWGEGKTAKEIAGVLGGGLTRNAVIGKAHRLNLSGRASPIQQNISPARKKLETKARETGKLKDIKPKIQPKEAQKRKSETEITFTRRKKEVPAEAFKALGAGVKLEDIKDRMCRWPIGDPKSPNFHFCGAQCDGQTPYCEAHAKVAYNITLKNRKITAFEEGGGKSFRDEADDLLASVANAS